MIAELRLQARACQRLERYALPVHQVRVHRCLLNAYTLQGRPDQALGEAMQIQALSGLGGPITGEDVADPGEVLSAYHRWSSRQENLAATLGATSDYVRARALASALEIEGALGALEAAASGREPRLLEIRIDPRFDPLRDHPRFQALLALLAGAEDRSGTSRPHSD